MREFKLGDREQISKKITPEDVADFARLSLDHNPVHLDAEYAKTTRFGRPIAHGIYVASLISAVIGEKLPGRGAIYLEQTLSFKKPVFIGDTVTAEVSVIEIPKPSLLKMSTICRNQDGVVVIEGTALIKIT